MGQPERGEIGATWVLLRPEPESPYHPGTEAARMRRLLKALGRRYGIRVEAIQARGPDGRLVDGFRSEWGATQ